MKTLRITTKKKYNSDLLDSLFKSGKTLNTFPDRLDGGRYKWTGSASDYEGKEVSVPQDITHVWAERKTDSSGPYAALSCA